MSNLITKEDYYQDKSKQPIQNIVFEAGMP